MTQHMQALDLANERRVSRARIHHEIRDTHEFEASCTAVATVLAGTPPPCLGGMRVEELLQWIVCQRGTPKARFIGEALEAAGCSEFKYVRELTGRQRTVLADFLAGFAYGRRAA